MPLDVRNAFIAAMQVHVPQRKVDVPRNVAEQRKDNNNNNNNNNNKGM